MNRFGRGVALAALAVTAGTAAADVRLTRNADGSALIYNDVGSGWLVNGRAPSDGYLVDRRAAPGPYDDAIDDFAGRLGVDPKLVKSVMLVESNFNPRAVSRKGARGLMQLMPETARRFGVTNRFDPLENLRGGAEFLASLLKLFSGDLPLALAAYNAGEGAVAKHSGVPPYAETREYIRRILVADRGTAAPVLSGGFRGTPAGASAARAPARPAAPVRVASVNGTTVLTNVALVERFEPVLGRSR
jgi:soluble lytic murein transglycosylase-like protein